MKHIKLFKEFNAEEVDALPKPYLWMVDGEHSVTVSQPSIINAMFFSPDGENTLRVLGSAQYNIKYADMVDKVYINGQPASFESQHDRRYISVNVPEAGDAYYQITIRFKDSIKTLQGAFRDNANITVVDLSRFNSSITSTYQMFYNCANLEGVEIGNFNTRKVTTMQQMFNLCPKLTELDLSTLKVDTVHNMELFAKFCTNLETVIMPKSTPTNLISLAQAFANCESLKAFDLGETWSELPNLAILAGILKNCYMIEEINWSLNTPSLVDLSTAFAHMPRLRRMTLDIDVANVTNISNLAPCYANEYPIVNPLEYVRFTRPFMEDVLEDVTDIFGMSPDSRPCGVLITESNFEDGVYNLIQTALPTGMTHMCADDNYFIATYDVKAEDIESGDPIPIFGDECPALGDITTYVLGAQIPNYTFEYQFTEPSRYSVLVNWPNGVPSDINYMFGYCKTLVEVDFSHWSTAGVNDISRMFEGCSGLSELDVNNFDTSEVEYMNGMFAGCTGLQSMDLNNWDVTNLLETNAMFSDCTNLTEVLLETWGSARPLDMQWMFANCISLTSDGISDMDTGGVAYFNGMYSGCINLQSVRIPSMEYAMECDEMFMGCEKLLDIVIGSPAPLNFQELSVADMFTDLPEEGTLSLANYQAQEWETIKRALDDQAPTWTVESY